MRTPSTGLGPAEVISETMPNMLPVGLSGGTGEIGGPGVSGGAAGITGDPPVHPIAEVASNNTSPSRREDCAIDIAATPSVTGVTGPQNRWGDFKDSG